MKPGYKTTEFWLSGIAALVGIVTASGAFGDDGPVMKMAGMAMSVLAAMGYSVGRGLAKGSGAS